MKGKPLFIAIFPYMFFDSEEEVRVGDVTLRSAYKKLLESEVEDIREWLYLLPTCFRVDRAKQEPVVFWSYAVLNVSNQQQVDEAIRRLSRVADLLRFAALRKEQDRGHYSNFNYWLFQLHPDIRPDSEYVYAAAFLNGLATYNFDFKNGAAADPVLPHRNLSPELIRLSDLEQDNYISALYRNHSFIFREEQAREKIFRAIEWFNRSFSHGDRGVDMAEAVTNMHSALEALLKPQQKERSNVKAEVRQGS